MLTTSVPIDSKSFLTKFFVRVWFLMKLIVLWHLSLTLSWNLVTIEISFFAFASETGFSFEATDLIYIVILIIKLFNFIKASDQLQAFF